MSDRFVKKSEKKLIFFANKARMFFCFLIISSIAFLLYSAAVEKGGPFSRIFLLLVAGYLQIFALFGLLALFLGRFRLEVNLHGIKIFGLHKTKILAWEEIRGIFKKDYSLGISISTYHSYFPIMTSPPKGFSSYDFYNFLVNARCMILSGHISSNDGLCKLLLEILEENKMKQNMSKNTRDPLWQFDKGKIINEIDVEGIGQYVFRAPATGNNIFLLKFNFFPSRYIAGMILLFGVASFLFQSLLFITHDSWSFLVIFMGLLCFVLFGLLYKSYVAIFYDPTLKIAYRGYGFAGKIFRVKKVIDDIQAIALFNRTWRISYYWVGFSNFGHYVYCKLFITKYAAQKFQDLLAERLNLSIVDFGQTESLSNKVRYVDRGFDVIIEVFTLFVLSFPYIGLIKINYNLLSKLSKISTHFLGNISF